MDGKLFGQIVALIVIAAVVMTLTKCIAKKSCPMMKSKCVTCPTK